MKPRRRPELVRLGFQLALPWVGCAVHALVRWAGVFSIRHETWAYLSAAWAGAPTAAFRLLPVTLLLAGLGFAALVLARAAGRGIPALVGLNGAVAGYACLMTEAAVATAGED